MKNIDEANRWIKQGERDLTAAKELIRAEIYETVCFLCQQAVEKMLKGLLYGKGYRVITTHSVKKLFNSVKEVFDDVKPLDRICMELDKQYIPSRYPDAFPEGSPYEYYTKEDSEKCINYATLILEEVKRLMQNL